MDRLNKIMSRMLLFINFRNTKKEWDYFNPSTPLLPCNDIIFFPLDEIISNKNFLKEKTIENFFNKLEKSSKIFFLLLHNGKPFTPPPS